MNSYFNLSVANNPMTHSWHLKAKHSEYTQVVENWREDYPSISACVKPKLSITSQTLWESRHLPIQRSRKLHYRTRHLNFSFPGRCKFVFSLSTFKPAVKVTSIRIGTVTYSSSSATISSASWNFTFSPVLDTFSKSIVFQKKYSAATDEITGMYSQFSLTADPVSKLHFCTTHYLRNSLSTFLKFDRTEGLLLKW